MAEKTKIPTIEELAAEIERHKEIMRKNGWSDV